MIFNTTDMDGDRYSDMEFSKHKLTMMNFWEPWCGPCVRELPDLQKLYEKYKDKGFIILGVFSDPSQDDKVREIIKNAGITYPILRYCSSFEYLYQGYVPMTMFIGPQGNNLTFRPYIGSRSFEGWDELVSYYLGEAR